MIYPDDLEHFLFRNESILIGVIEAKRPLDLVFGRLSRSDVQRQKKLSK